MAGKLEKMGLDELYQRKVTASVEKYILLKDNFSVKSANWCDKVCRLKHKCPSTNLINSDPVDVLIIQDFKAFDEPKFRKSGAVIERKHLEIINDILRRSLPKGVRARTTSLLRCPIKEEDLTKGYSPPTATTLSKCKPYLFEEIRQVKPKVIISLSTVVTKVLKIKASNAKNVGEVHHYVDEAAGLRIPVVITLHPRSLLMLRQNASGAFWGPDFFSVIRRDFWKAGQLAVGNLKPRLLEEAIEDVSKQIYIARTLDQVKEFVGILQAAADEGKVLSWDTETTSLDPFEEKAKLLTMQFGFRGKDGKIESYVFPLWHRVNTWYNANEAYELIKPLLVSEEVQKIGHNVKFDLIYTRVTTGVEVKGIVFDTMLILHACNSGLQGMYGLKKAVHDYLTHMWLGGYEDLLPKLTKKKKTSEEGESSENSEEEDNDEEQVDD